MDIDRIRDKLNLTSDTALARVLGTSPSHVADLRSKRRRLSLKLAAKLVALTGDQTYLTQAVADRISA